VYVWIAIGVLSLALAAVASLLYQVLRQQGRILLSVESLEQRLHAAAVPTQPQGIPVGETFPSFRLPDPTGRTIGLDDYRGNRTVLVHWSPSCGFCDLIASELAALAPKLVEAKTNLLLISYGDVDSNLEFAERHGLEYPLLLADGSESPAGFVGMGTPVAYVLDEVGRVAEPLAVGAGEVPALVRSEAEGRRRLDTERSLVESRIERDGLKTGTAAPLFDLQDLDDERISLREYRGRRVLLVFSDPDCGPCDALAPELVDLHERLGESLAIVMVSRGDEAENRRKADTYGFQFPVVIQPGWKLSKKYGIFATPVAFVIDEEGVIARDVARGAEQIVALAKATGAAEKEVAVHSG
jgi:peroxiredoxin